MPWQNTKHVTQGKSLQPPTLSIRTLQLEWAGFIPNTNIGLQIWSWISKLYPAFNAFFSFLSSEAVHKIQIKSYAIKCKMPISTTDYTEQLLHTLFPASTTTAEDVNCWKTLVCEIRSGTQLTLQHMFSQNQGTPIQGMYTYIHTYMYTFIDLYVHYQQRECHHLATKSKMDKCNNLIQTVWGWGYRQRWIADGNGQWWYFIFVTTHDLVLITHYPYAPFA